LTHGTATLRRALPTRDEAIKLFLVAAVYYVAATLSLRLALVERNVTPFWPPTGIAVVAFMLLGGRIWPAIAAGAFFVNLTISPSPLVAATIAIGNTLAPYVASRVLAATDFRRDLGRLRDAAVLVFGAALPSTLISASIGTLSLLFSKTIPAGALLSTWSVWWTGDAMGILVIAPLLLTWSTVRPARVVPWRRTMEAIVVGGAVVAASLLILRSRSPLFVVVFPPLCWAAWRFQQRGASPAVVWISTVATWAAVHDEGLFRGLHLLDKMLSLQAFNAAISFTSLFLATAVAARLRAEKERQRLAERERQAQRELYKRQHQIAETLQRSLLPDRLPDVPDVALVARYVPATGDVQVGGDWYDVVVLPDGRIAFAIGDVAGHGIPAAAAMGQMRTALRAYAFEVVTPAIALQRLNILLRELRSQTMATAIYLNLDPNTGELQFTNAGHPPPLVLEEDGSSRFLGGAAAPPLGVIPDLTYQTSSDRLGPGATLVLYTDGLVEKRGRAIEAGLADLKAAADDAPKELDDLCDHILGSLHATDSSDDIAILALRRISLAGRSLTLSRRADPEAASEIRHLLGRWLEQNGVGSQETFDVVLACSEACTNAIQHAYGPPGGPLEIRAEIHDGAVVIRVRDSGTWRAPELSHGLGGGRGIGLMRGTMDDVDVASGADGTEVTLRRKLRIEARHD
jgi:serine phosphatase RsbU (regulator of sigma subunit)/integral membrane sensor domain MASE1/anti-sigma regulatory factor (Ser/Thr protein kinase)